MSYPPVKIRVCQQHHHYFELAWIPLTLLILIFWENLSNKRALLVTFIVKYETHEKAVRTWFQSTLFFEMNRCFDDYTYKLFRKILHFKWYLMIRHCSLNFKRYLMIKWIFEYLIKHLCALQCVWYGLWKCRYDFQLMASTKLSKHFQSGCPWAKIDWMPPSKKAFNQQLAYEWYIGNSDINVSQLAKMKKSIPDISLPSNL